MTTEEQVRPPRPMRIWLLKLGEPVPTDPGPPRLLRMGMLAGLLAARGHDVLWWSSTLDHVRKVQRAERDEDRLLPEGYALRLLWGPAYLANISLRRVLHHRWVASSFERRAAGERPPDLILCAYPTLELAEKTVAYGRRHGVPVVLDVRDMWPELFLDLAPGPLRPLARLVLEPDYRRARRAIRDATAITGITDEVVRWARDLGGGTPGAPDRAFHLSTEVPNLSSTQRAAAERFWDGLGVSTARDSFVASFVGTMSGRMEHAAVVDAGRAAAMRHPRAFRLVLCGAGDQLEPLRTRAAGNPNIVLPGHVDAACVRVLLERSTCGLLPYPAAMDFALSIPNKVGEYLSAGLPIASSAPGTTARLLDRHGCGFTYGNGDSGALLAGWERWIAEPERVRHERAAASRLFAEQFDSTQVYRAFCEHLERLVPDTSGQPI